MTMVFRPWGKLRWLFPKLGIRGDWSFLGALSSEDRSLTALGELDSLCSLSHSRLWHIDDGADSPYRTIAQEAFDGQRDKFEKMGITATVKTFLLMESDIHLGDELEEFITKTSGNVVLDISSMPKRWFFPALRTLLLDERVENLVVVYSVPSRYSSLLGEDPCLGDISLRLARLVMITIRNFTWYRQGTKLFRCLDRYGNPKEQL